VVLMAEQAYRCSIRKGAREVLQQGFGSSKHSAACQQDLEHLLTWSSMPSGSSRHTSMSLLLQILRQFAVDPNRCTFASGHWCNSVLRTCSKAAFWRSCSSWLGRSWSTTSFRALLSCPMSALGAVPPKALPCLQIATRLDTRCRDQFE